MRSIRWGSGRSFDRHVEVLNDLRSLALIDFAVEGGVARPVLHELFHLFIRDRPADVARLVGCATPSGAPGARTVIDGVINRYVTAVQSRGREGHR